jgi:hypothetical protein
MRAPSCVLASALRAGKLASATAGRRLMRGFDRDIWKSYQLVRLQFIMHFIKHAVKFACYQATPGEGENG